MTTTIRFKGSRRSVLKGSGAFLVGMTFMPRFAMSQEEKALSLYNWDTYIGDNTLSDFNTATGIEARMDIFGDNAELFATLQGGNPGYDVIVPSSDLVERMIAAGMLEEIDYSKVPNSSNISDAFKDATFDPGRKHSVPYMWGTQGIGYRKSRVNQSDVASWGAVFENDAYAGRIALLGDGESVIGAALKYLGYSLNSVDPAETKAAEELLIAGKKNIRVYADDDHGQDLLVSGEVDLAMEWNGDIIQVMEEDSDLSYIVPDEGSLLWQDCMCIPKGAPHPENAHAFLNFVLDADAGAHIAETIRYATANDAAKAKMGEDYTGNPGIFPPDDVIAKCEVALYSEEKTRMREESWVRIQAA
jgi:spermidine/putrescine transport system substrate-binding protein